MMFILGLDIRKVADCFWFLISVEYAVCRTVPPDLGAMRRYWSCNADGSQRSYGSWGS